jgi:hypothetical protein
VRDWERHGADVVCDFRQFYGVDLPLAPEEGADLARLATLWTGLPRESRTARRMDPSLEWGPTDYLLRNVELWTHLAWWAQTKDARRRRNAPKPVETPGEAADARVRAERARASRRRVALMLGVDPGVMDD